MKQKKILWDDFRLFTTLKKQYTHHILKIGLPVAVLNTLFAFVNMFLGRTATEQGGHLGLMALTTGGQIEAITWNTSQGLSAHFFLYVTETKYFLSLFLKKRRMKPVAYFYVSTDTRNYL